MTLLFWRVQQHVESWLMTCCDADADAETNLARFYYVTPKMRH